jgi:hypothetical protein
MNPTQIRRLIGGSSTDTKVRSAIHVRDLARAT